MFTMSSIITRLQRGLLIALVCIPLTSHANIIVNGSFENNDVANGRWKFMSSSLVDGWSGSNIEIWDNHRREKAADGSQFIELNAHGKRNGQFYNIFQQLDTVAGERYDLSFAYQARRNSNEAFKVQLFNNDNELFQDWIFDDHTKENWSFYEGGFTAKSDSTRLRFVSLNRGTVGNFLDDIAVTKSKSSNIDVSEPATLFLLAVGVVALISLKRRAS